MIENLLSHLTRHWYRYVKLAFVYAMVFQITFVFDFLWYDRTYTMLAVLFVWSVIIHIVSYKLHRLVRYGFDLLAAILIGMNYKESWEDIASLEGISYFVKLGIHFADSWQFYGVGIFVLTIAQLVYYVTEKRYKFILFFVTGLFTLLIVDSFSPIVLWLHVIVLVILFLLWHMCWHYERIRQQDEEEFEVLTQSLESLFTPVAIVVTLSIVLSLILPYGPPLLEDPYALWKKSRGEEVPAFLGNKGFKSPIVRTQNRESGYSRNTSHLGGGFDFNYETVMEIETSYKTYWRGETLNYYDGLGWKETRGYEGYFGFTPDDVFTTDRPLSETVENVAVVKVVRPIGYPVIFQASEIKQLDQVTYTFNNSLLLGTINPLNQYSTSTANREQVMYDPTIDLPGLLFLERDRTIVYDQGLHSISYPSSYRVTSEMLLLDPGKLTLASAEIADAALHDLYTQIPESLPQEVIDLANLITEPAQSDYERAKLLENYLKQNYAYANRPNEERLTGEEDDFVYKFLFELYEGYCDHFSTAMAVMAKALDLPARWVKGFTPGVNLNEQLLLQAPIPLEELQEIRNKTEGGTFNVRNADAHSWVEIYFEGYGWVAFEPTPGFEYPYDYVGDLEEENLPVNQNVLDAEDELDKASSHKAAYQYRVPLVIVGSLLLLAALAMVWRKRDTIKFRFARLRHREFTNNDHIVYQFNSFLRYCKRRGLVRAEGQTVYGAISSWTHGSKYWKRQLLSLYQLYEKARYAKVELEESDVKQTTEFISGLKKQWKK